MENQTKPGTFYWVIAVIAVLWNIMGCISFATEYNQWTKPESWSDLPEGFKQIYEAYPSWLFVVFGIAVLSGLIGSIGLLLRKKWSIQVFLVSLLAVVIQFGYFLFGMDTLNILGNSAAIMPMVVIAGAAFLYYFAKRSYGQDILA